MSKELNSSQRLAITILRILSCIAVFSIHYFQRYGNLFPPIANRAASFGQDGLWMFFIISGFLLCHSNRDKEFFEKSGRCRSGGGVQLKRYYLGRIFRIVPLAWTWLIVIYIVNAVFLQELPVWNWRWLISIFFLNMVIPTSSYYTWNGMYLYGSLSSFMFVYAVFPFIKHNVRNFSDSLLFLIVSTVIYALNNTLSIVFLSKYIGGNAYILRSVGILSTSWFFVLGIVLYHAFNEQKLKHLLPILMPIYLVLLRYDFTSEVFKGSSIGILMTIILAACLIVFEGNASNLKCSIFNIIERYTFPLFICHILIFNMVEKTGTFINLETRVIAILNIIMSIIMSIILYHCVCVPGNILWKKLQTRILK